VGVHLLLCASPLVGTSHCLSASSGCRPLLPEAGISLLPD
jgi:hypothetical protein